MRTRLIVAFAALMAATALVAVPGPASSRPTSGSRTGPATLTAVALVLPGDTAMSNQRSNTASGPAGGLGPATALVEPGTVSRPSRRKPVVQPGSAPSVFNKNYWRFDRDISWYGPGFFGSGTACGQVYTRGIMGVAHRTLPCGTLVTFRNPANGREVTVPVIDRGPYVAGRTWDMSRGLCEVLDHCYTGTIEWRWGH